MDKAEKLRLKQERMEQRKGKPIICKRCRREGGTLTKAGPGVYVHFPTCLGRKADDAGGPARGG